jgi:hypothetical protein
MRININDDLINKLKEQADNKDLSEVVAQDGELYLICSECEATSADAPNKFPVMANGGDGDRFYQSLLKHDLWNE